MRSRTGALTVAVVALFLGVLVVSQFRSREAFSRTLQQETPETLTTLIADLSDRNRQLRDEIFDLRSRLEQARSSIAGGRGALEESERELAHLQVFSARSAVSGPGIAVRIVGPFDERALSDLVNELRNAGAEAIAVNDRRVGPRTWFGPGPEGTLVIDGAQAQGPWIVRAIGAVEVLYVGLTRTGGIVGQFQLIYDRTRFDVTREPLLRLPALSSP
ncbi:MAG: hypothetical protein A3G84_02720 [Chloroflexi bacterium RIFCSPLOWO2_12_FULL_71_12]|nr:MAG: hypothetical protein A3H36_03180 [Chloroflexi bacterium RIFCSPLOWO2_02_FULL_71_16]OGO73455.1 MAG: hypothetical protein A3G84_02720 [Chloroflexi bacterium RIFCSPLOWO2_12_FULL_71_12]